MGNLSSSQLKVATHTHTYNEVGISAGTGLTNNEGVFAVDTTTIATKADIADLGSFTVVDTLPSVATADTKTIYLLGPIGTGADKYEEWIVTEISTPGHFESATEVKELILSTPGYPEYILANQFEYNDAYIGINYLGDCTDVHEGDPTSTPVVTFPYLPNDKKTPVFQTYFASETCQLSSNDFVTACSESTLTWVPASTQKVWTKIGETSIDLSGYATTTALTNGLATKQDTLTASDGIDIDGSNNISVDVTDIIGTGLTEDASNNIIVDTTVVATQTDLSGKQDKATSGSTAPSTTPTYVGQMYVDTTNDNLYVATGTSSSSDWTAVDTNTTYTAGDGIDITNNEISLDIEEGIGIEITGGTVCAIESDRKGPAPSGFHVPSMEEFGDFVDLVTAIGITTGPNFGTYLLMPFAGYRNYTNSNIAKSGSVGGYWTSSYSKYESDTSKAYCLTISNSALRLDTSNRALGRSIRCFKNTPVVPRNDWTVLYQGPGSAGIFHNAVEGLISVTADGTNYVTISDKNLGATTTYNHGDSYTESNCGKLYQWGNNYGFQYSGTISSTSSIQVDAIGYGPTNYYSSDTFITGNYDWASAVNNDLWGDITNSTHQECTTSDVTISADTTVLQEKLTAGDGIDIDANDEISVDVTDIIGTGLSEDANNNIIVDTTVVATQTDLSGKQDKATSGSTAPSTTPSYVGQQYVDTTADKLYVATGTSSSSDWTEVGAGSGDMLYSDFGWDTLTGATVTLALRSEITPSANFTVNKPNDLKDGQFYVLRVDNGATAYTMTLGTGVTNPYSEDLTLVANNVQQFMFLAKGGNLELQPSTEIDISGKQDKATSGSTAPSTTPSYIGQQYVDTTNNLLYVAKGTSSSSDWIVAGKTYSAGTGLTLNGTQFAVDTTTIATKSDIANLSSFEVVDTLPSTSTASTKTIYLLGPIGTGADKYEEWIITNPTIEDKVTLSSSSSSGTISDAVTITASDISITRASGFIIAYYIDVYQNGSKLFSYSDGGVPSGLLDANGDPVDSITIPAGTISASDFSTITSISIKVGEHTEKTWTKIGETSIDLSGYALDSNVNTKTFTLSSASDLSTIRDAIAWKNAGKNPIIAYNGYYYETGSYSSGSSWTLYATKVDTSVSGASQNKMVIAYDMGSPVSITISSDAISSGASGDMLYADFNWVTKTGNSITLSLNSTITPSANFTVNAPATIQDGQIYVLRVVNGATAYTMTLSSYITNPYNVATTLTANYIDQFVFLAVGGSLELLPASDADLSGKQDKATSGSSAPATTPTYVGQSYVNTSTTTPFVATGTSASTDWQGIPILSKQTGAATNVKIWVGTQAAYEALSGSYDANTLYFTTSSS